MSNLVNPSKRVTFCLSAKFELVIFIYLSNVSLVEHMTCCRTRNEIQEVSFRDMAMEWIRVELYLAYPEIPALIDYPAPHLVLIT
jgi:hypothetical protein